MQLNRFLAALVLAGALIPAAAGAVTTTTVVATDGQQAVPRSSVQLFDTATGAEVKQEDEDDDGPAVFLLPQGSYRVVINGTPIEEFTVTGEGTRTVTVSVGGAATATGAAHGGPEIYVGIEGSFLWHLDDEFYAFSGVDPDDLAQPDRGFGGRLFAAGEFDERYLARAALSGAWLSGDLREESSGLISEEEARIDALWATLDFFRLWVGRDWLLGLGGGLEYADLRHRFDSSLTDEMSGTTFIEVRQESGFWGIGPRVGGMVEHELFSGVRGFAEGGVGYLFGDRETAVRFDISGSEAERQESSGERLLHFSARVGLRREFDLNGLDFTLFGGWQFDQFNDAFNLEFLPNDVPGDVQFHGPFVGVGVRWGG
ncbi:MAG: Legionella pneumophila major outer membrane protein precursor [Rhodospirillales bacterium]|jgi:hypothetical protein|nr:Legionella pneumophila major outer membrane protein precursor [Rhodospirillales bacterium]